MEEVVSQFKIDSGIVVGGARKDNEDQAQKRARGHP
jgi:hypothetical protein